MCFGLGAVTLRNVFARCLGLLLLIACAPYQSGAVFDVATPDGGRRFECVDLQVTPSFSVKINELRSYLPIRFAFGNHCRHAVPLNLSAVRVRATFGEREIPLMAFDPRDEIHPAQIDGRMRAEEIIAFEIPPNWVGNQLQICVKLDLVAESVENPSSFCFDWAAY